MKAEIKFNKDKKIKLKRFSRGQEKKKKGINTRIKDFLKLKGAIQGSNI